MKFRKKPIVIEATQWFRHGDHAKVEPFCKKHHVPLYGICKECPRPLQDHGSIKTSDGGYNVCPGDWIITDIDDESYPCKPHIFDKTYDIEPE